MFTFFASSRSPLPGGDDPPATGHAGSSWQVLLTLAVVFVVLTTTGWTAVQTQGAVPGPRAAALLAWQRDRAAGGPLPDPQAPPARIAGFFGTLTPAQQQQLAVRHPLVVGNLDGVPPRLRYRANRAALRDARDRERRRMRDPRLSTAGRHTAGRRMHRFTSMLRPGRQIIAFDPTGPGQAAEVLGDLAAADRVAVVVPGVDTELLTFERTNLLFSAPVGMAGAVRTAAHRTDPDTDVAVVAWADYTAPDGLGMDAATGDLAEAGARRLASFVRALPGGAPVTLLCHSYGSVVCGLSSDRLPRRVTDIAVAGSPGIRADRAADLDTSARVWAMRTEDDWIGDVPHLQFGELGHGPDPVSPAFGARRLATVGASGHRAYFVPGTTSLANLARIASGAYSALDCAAADSHCAAGTG